MNWGLTQCARNVVCLLLLMTAVEWTITRGIFHCRFVCGWMENFVFLRVSLWCVWRQRRRNISKHNLPCPTWSVFSQPAKRERIKNNTRPICCQLLHTCVTTWILFFFSLFLYLVFIRFLLVGCRWCSCGWFRFFSFDACFFSAPVSFCSMRSKKKPTKFNFPFLPSELEWNFAVRGLK